MNCDLASTVRWKGGRKEKKRVNEVQKDGMSDGVKRERKEGKKGKKNKKYCSLTIKGFMALSYLH